ncbi:MAG: RtcB family protein [Haloarculaceae archaeon]
MTTFDAGPVTLERVREFVWEIPQDGEMRVPARVFASEELLEEITEDKTLQQLRNTTHLPGIRKYAVCMPDGHQGYGFPVGGVAGIDAEDGCISPGAVGYDINCLPGNSEVLLEFGRRRALDSLRDDFETERAVVAADSRTPSEIRLLTETEDRDVYELTTGTGETIEATANHPFRTPDGMVPLETLEPGDRVFVSPFRGIEDEKPADRTLLTESDFADENPQIRRVLDERDVLPLSTADETFNRLLKVIGFFTGDGSFGGGGQTWFYGDPEDLERIREDIHEIGFKPSKTYSRERQHDTDGKTFQRVEHSFKTTSRAFRLLLQKLGAPAGEKVSSGFSTPEYFEHLTNWQKALYYASYFGAEMNAPSAQHDKTLYCPKVSQTRTVGTADAGREFMHDLGSFLSALGIETNAVEEFDTDSNASHETVRLRLGVKNDSENLIRFYSRVGFRYNREKRRLAAKAVQYLRRKEQTIERREHVAERAKAMADGGTSVDDIKGQFDINDRFIERSVWSGRNGHPRPPADFPGFEEFCEGTRVRDDMTVETTVADISPAGSRTVYDIGVAHDAHNFIADGFVVSNCGVRMVRTDLDYDDVRGREEQFVERLFEAVPTGLGGGGVHEGTVGDVEAILERGMDWALEEGYAVRDDLAHCEDEGHRPEGDASAVSQKAKDRGKNQVGSLGSGNHFLEVQRVTDVFLDDVAADFGLGEDQVVVLIHCGSRGLGHQVCTDYLREIEGTHQGLLNQLPDKELAAAPAGSQLADEYYRAMCAAINFAWVNRQLITYQTRQVFADVFDAEWEDLGMELLYDVAHNIAKREVHDVAVGPDGGPAGDGTTGREERELFVHRKGATRSFPAGRPELPAAYRDVGQPVIIPGSMGAGSYVLRGGEQSLAETFGSTAHGAGRLMSRTQAKDEFWGEDVQQDLRERQQVYVKAQSGATVAEEAPGVYKDVDEVIRVSDALGIGDRVARTFPVCNIKG